VFFPKANSYTSTAVTPLVPVLFVSVFEGSMRQGIAVVHKTKVSVGVEDYKFKNEKNLRLCHSKEVSLVDLVGIFLKHI